MFDPSNMQQTSDTSQSLPRSDFREPADYSLESSPDHCYPQPTILGGGWTLPRSFSDAPLPPVSTHYFPANMRGTAVAVFLGGSVGALARYGLGLWIGELGGIPLATLIANLSGSALLGFLAGLAEARSSRGVGWALGGVGFSGAFTTFSTFALEAVHLGDEHGLLAAVAYVTASVLGGLFLASAARRGGRRW